MATKTLLTVEEFVRLPEPPDAHYELVEGELITVSPGMLRHNLVRDKLLRVLAAFVEGRKLGTVVSEQSFHLFRNTVRVPDLAFVRAGKSLPLDKLPEGAPDLVVEVISPTNTAREIDRRVSDYFAAGCQRVWLVYPEDREVYVQGLGGIRRRQEEELLEEPELLPGFSVKVSSLFEQGQ